MPLAAQELIRGMIDINPVTRLTVRHTLQGRGWSGSVLVVICGLQMNGCLWLALRIECMLYTERVSGVLVYIGVIEMLV